MKTITFALLATLFLFPACGNIRPAPDQINTAYYGSSPKNPEAAVLKFWEDKLYDPYSAVVKCDEPRKGWVNELGKISYGWICICSLNAKNRLGGYVGAKPDRYLFHGETIVKHRWGVHEFVE